MSSLVLYIPRVILTSGEGRPCLCVLEMLLLLIFPAFENVITETCFCLTEKKMKRTEVLPVYEMLTFTFAQMNSYNADCSPSGRYCDYPHPADENAEAQRS